MVLLLARMRELLRGRRGLLALGIAAAGWLLLTTVSHGDGGSTAVLWWTAADGLLVVVTANVALRERVFRTPVERELWRPLSFAGRALGAGFVLQMTLALGTGSPIRNGSGWLEASFVVSVILACAGAYWGLAQWNRFATPLLSDPAAWLNGASSALALAAVGDLIVHWSGSSLAKWPWWQLQAWLLTTAATVIVLATLASVTFVAKLGRDPRTWLLGAGVAAGLGGEIAAGFTGTGVFSFGSWSETGWLIALTLMAAAAALQPRSLQPQAATTLSTTAGMMAVLTVSMTIAGIDASFPRSAGRMSALYAVLAFAGAGAQGLRIIRDLAQLARSQIEARTDELTGTANRRALMAHLEAEIARQQGLCLLVLDLDHFKDVNDRHGHAMGDQLLQRTAERLTRRLPADAVLARLGGDEFAVLLRATLLQQAIPLAEALVAEVSAVIVIDGRWLRVGASVGLVAYPTSTAAAVLVGGDELLHRADTAMYVSKRSETAVSVYDPELEARARQRSERADELRLILADDAPAAARDEIVVHYQPQLDLQTSHIVGVEALVRWQHPHHGLLSPADFLDLVEEQGLMASLTDNVMTQATEQAAQWRLAGHPLRISVNVSASTLADPRLPALIDRTLALNSLPAALLTIEVTETMLMTNPEPSLQAIRLIAAKGVGVSIDDYGTGYSSLAYLNDLAASELKIDRALTANIVTNPRTAAIVGGTIELAHRLNLRVVAEGVEDQQTHHALQALHCDEAQGFLYSRPQPAAALSHQLRQAQPQIPAV